LPDSPSNDQLDRAWDAAFQRKRTRAESEDQEAKPKPAAARAQDGVHTPAVVGSARHLLQTLSENIASEATEPAIERRARVVEGAIAEDKIPVSRRQHYREALLRDERGTTAFLESLPSVPGLNAEKIEQEAEAQSRSTQEGLDPMERLPT